MKRKKYGLFDRDRLQYEAAEAEAREVKRDLWQQQQATPPWEWRKKKSVPSAGWRIREIPSRASSPKTHS